MCLVFFFAFNFFLLFLKREKENGQYQYQENIIKGQRYLYEAETPENVVIGTSLSNRLLTDSLKNIYSLALAGLNVFDGLHIVLAKKDIPKNIYIEFNYFFKPQNQQFSSLFDSKPGNILKKNLIALRESNQPVGVLRYVLGSLVHSPKKPANNPKTEPGVPSGIFSQLLAMQEKQYSTVDTSLIRNSLDELQQAVADMTARGSKICFFEMPVSPELEDLPLANYVRTSIEKRFAGSKNVVIMKLPPRKGYETADGVHLDAVSASKYTQYFKEEMDRIPG